MTPDKKQKAQVAVLGVLLVAFIGYIAYTMIPSPPAHVGPPIITVKADAKPLPTASSMMLALDVDSPSPSDTMKNPFIAKIAAPDINNDSPPPQAPVRTQQLSHAAQQSLPVPQAPVLPSMPLGVATQLPLATPGSAAQPTSFDPGAMWTVSGVTAGNGQRVAVLKDGTKYKFVHEGDDIVSGVRVLSVNDSGVVLFSHGQKVTLRIPNPSSGSKNASPPQTSPSN